MAEGKMAAGTSRTNVWVCGISPSHNQYKLLMNQVSTMGGNVQKSSSSPALSGVEGKAAALLVRGAYSQYVSTAKGRRLPVRAALANPGNAAGGFF